MLSTKTKQAYSKQEKTTQLAVATPSTIENTKILIQIQNGKLARYERAKGPDNRANW